MSLFFVYTFELQIKHVNGNTYQPIPTTVVIQTAGSPALSIEVATVKNITKLVQCKSWPKVSALSLHHIGQSVDSSLTLCQRHSISAELTYFEFESTAAGQHACFLIALTWQVLRDWRMCVCLLPKLVCPLYYKIDAPPVVVNNAVGLHYYV